MLVWSSAAVDSRLREMIDTARRLDGRGCWPQIIRTCWPAYPDEYWTAAATKAEKQAATASLNQERPWQGPPSPGAIDRHDQVVEWLSWLERPRRRIVVSIACGVGSRRVASFASRSKSTVNRVYRLACRDIATRLNRRC